MGDGSKPISRHVQAIILPRSAWILSQRHLHLPAIASDVVWPTENCCVWDGLGMVGDMAMALFQPVKVYPLLCQNSDWKWWFSIVMFVYQRVKRVWTRHVNILGILLEERTTLKYHSCCVATPGIAAELLLQHHPGFRRVHGNQKDAEMCKPRMT